MIKYGLLLFVCLLSLPIKAQRLAEFISNWEEKRHRFLPIPLIAYTPETNWMFGASVAHLYRLKDDSLSNVSYTSLTGFYTLNRQYVFNLQFQFNFKENTNRLEGAAVFEKYPFQYFGLGNWNTSEDREAYNSNQMVLKLRYLRKVLPGFFIGLQVRHQSAYNIEAQKEGGLFDQGLVPGGDGFDATGIGANLTYDTRDNPFYPFEGHYMQLSNHNYLDILGSDMQFYNLKFDLRSYVNPGNRAHVLAFQSVFDFNIGEQPPFLMMAQIGGEQLLRGILRGKYRDRHMLLTQFEYRFPIWWRFSGAVFGGAAEVMDQWSDLDWPGVRLAGGAGLRFTLNAQERLNIRFDVGFGPDGSWNWYLVLNEAF
ncbi:MAG: BamA/TamA family outer membrane protein [Chitinophagales bacterium]